MTIADRFHAAVESGVVTAFASDYAPDARLEARLAGHEVVADGRDNIIAELSTWWSASSRLDDWDVAASDGGLRVMLEWSTGDDRSRDRSAQVHLIHLVDGLITRHYVFCVHPRFGPAPYVAGTTPSFLRGALRREPLRHGGDSGSHLERVVLADGSRAIVKHISPTWDWIMRATRDSGREAELWRDGTLQQLPGIDYPVIAVEQEGDGWAIALRDVSATLIPYGTAASREDARRLLQALDRMHRHFANRDVPGLCSLANRAYIFSPGVARAEYQSSFRIPRIVGYGWELFAAVVGDDDLASVILELTEDPSPLVAELERGGTTLLHGDFGINENSGLTATAVVAIDWAMACRGPADIDFSYFLQNWSQPYGASREDLIDDWRTLRGDDFDPRLLQLALLFEVVIKGWGWAYGTTLSPDPVAQANDAADMSWWLDQARRALEFWSP